MSAQQYNSNFKIEKLMESEVNSMGQKILYPQVKDAAVTMMKITFPPGETTGWHKHDIPVFSYILEGTLTVETEDLKSLNSKKIAALQNPTTSIIKEPTRERLIW